MDVRRLRAVMQSAKWLPGLTNKPIYSINYRITFSILKHKQSINGEQIDEEMNGLVKSQINIRLVN